MEYYGADILRSKMDANEYKDYLLGIVFYNYLSDSFLIKVYDLLYDEKPETLKTALEAYREALGDESAEELKEQIRAECHYVIEPELTYTYFADAARKLGEVVDVCSGRDYKHLGDGTIPVYGTGGYMLSVSEALSEKDDAIGIGRKGTIDNPYILRAPFWTVDTLFYCIPKNDFDLDFVFNIYQNINWKAMDESTGVPSLLKTAINNVAVMAPTKNEQAKLGKYFANLDRFITLHRHKCEDLQNIKKFMLQNMFV